MEQLAISKTKRKQQMLQLQKLAVRIASCDSSVWDSIELDDAICDAMHTYQRLKIKKSREAVRRQAQYLGKLLRGYDQQKLESYFIRREQMQRYRDGRAAHLAMWFSGLVDGSMVISQLANELPEIDLADLADKLAKVRAIAPSATPVELPPQDPNQLELWQLLVDALPKVD